MMPTISREAPTRWPISLWVGIYEMAISAPDPTASDSSSLTIRE